MHRCNYSFAAFSNIGESLENPSKYYRNNLGSTSILEVVDQNKLRRKNISFQDSNCFSSTCATWSPN